MKRMAVAVVLATLETGDGAQVPALGQRGGPRTMTPSTLRGDDRSLVRKRPSGATPYCRACCTSAPPPKMCVGRA